jgi:EAL domain-containing protein (putative c-di-GMP-specific phosphodiesterase class I)
VSDPREADILRAFGVDYLQGFLYSKPETREPWTN